MPACPMPACPMPAWKWSTGHEWIAASLLAGSGAIMRYA